MVLIEYPLSGAQYYQYKVPGYDIELRYAAINESMPPDVNYDDYYVVVCIGEDGYDYYRDLRIVSLIEPKYLYDSEPIPDYCKSAVVKALIDTYKDGIKSINENLDAVIFNLDRETPNYGLL